MGEKCNAYAESNRNISSGDLKGPPDFLNDAIGDSRDIPRPNLGQNGNEFVTTYPRYRILVAKYAGDASTDRLQDGITSMMA